MVKYSKTLLFVAFLFCLLEFGTALQCYSCSTQKNDKCQDPFNVTKNVAIECYKENHGCLKQITLSANKSSKIITRGCTPMTFCSDFSGVSEHCSMCEDFLCNSSSVLGPSLALSLFVLIKTWIGC